jgi:hypothetical protein
MNENRKANWNTTCLEPFDFGGSKALSTKGGLGELPGVLFRAVSLTYPLASLACQSKSERKNYYKICLPVNTRSSMTVIVSLEEFDFGGTKDLDFFVADCETKPISTMRRVA